MRVLQSYEQELVGLHRAMLAGDSEGDAADGYRDALEQLSRQLGDDDREMFAELSEDLFVIEGKRREIPLGGDHAQWNDAQRLRMAIDAYKFALRTPNDRDRLRFVLMLFRGVPGVLANATRAYMLGRCWEALGFYLAASCFYDFAFKEDGRANFAMMALDALAKGGHHTEVVSRISALERAPDTDPALTLRAAAVLLRLAATEAPDQQADTYARLILLVERAIDVPDVLPSIRAAALVAAGFAHGHLGDSVAELSAFSRAVAIKEFDATLVARGLALQPTNPEAALADFRQATELSTTLVQPFLYLAHSELLAGHPDRVLALAARGARLATPGPLRARFYEWLAIASAQLGRPEPEVRAHFTRALDDDPVNEMLRLNVERFEAAVSASREVEWNFDPPDAADARDELERAFASEPPLAA